jgi:hypothetical protein
MRIEKIKRKDSHKEQVETKLKEEEELKDCWWREIRRRGVSLLLLFDTTR